LNWFKSYLKDRSQQTYVSGLYSNPGHVFTGVPQGSVIGPTLFLLYSNDLPLSLTNSTADILQTIQLFLLIITMYMAC